MPSYVELKLGEYLVSVAPSDFGRRVIKGTPFYNGVDIWFNLMVAKPRIMEKVLGFPKTLPVDETLIIEWDLFDRDEHKFVVSPTKEEYHLKNKRTRKLAGEIRRLSWVDGDKYIFFTINNAIHIGRLWEFNRYDLRIKEGGGDKEKEIIAEFRLRDIDEHGENQHNLIITLILGAIVSFIISLITALIIGR